VSFTHVEDSGFYDCKVIDNDDHNVQLHVIVNENCESNENCSSENNSSSINPTIDVSTTNSYTSPELLQLQELFQQIEFNDYGDGLMADEPRGVFVDKSVVFDGFFLCLIFLVVWWRLKGDAWIQSTLECA
jgi:hypothetical protein